jgi:hypothetical protein
VTLSVVRKCASEKRPAELISPSQRRRRHKVDAARSVAVLANPLVAVRRAKAGVGATTHSAE